MNQISNFRFIESTALVVRLLGLSVLFIAALLFSNSVLAQDTHNNFDRFQNVRVQNTRIQNEFASPAQYQSNGFGTNQRGQLPSAIGDQPGNESSFENNVSGDHHVEYPASWPQKHVSFETQVQHASCETQGPASSPSSPAGSLESWIDTAGPAISGFKETIAVKAGGVLGMVTGKTGTASSPDVPRMFASLAFVVGAYFAFVWLMRKISPVGNSQLPTEIVQILGRTPFGPKQNLQVIRLGSKLVLLLNGPEVTHPIGEITDPTEVNYLTSLCGSRKNARTLMPPALTRPTPTAQSSPPIQITNDAGASGLANVLRSLENTVRQQARGSSFEA